MKTKPISLKSPTWRQEMCRLATTYQQEITTGLREDWHVYREETGHVSGRFLPYSNNIFYSYYEHCTRWAYLYKSNYTPLRFGK